MKIVHIPRRFVRHEWGGTETVVSEICKRQLHAGHDCRIFTSMALARCRRESIATVPVRRFPYWYPYFGLSAAAVVALDKIGGNLFSPGLGRALWREPGVDLIHLHTGKRLGGIARTIGRLRNIPYLVSLHGGSLDVPDSEVSRWTEPTRGAWEWGKILGWAVGSRRVLQDAAALLCLGHAEAAALRRTYPQQRVEILPNGVDVARFSRGDGASFRLRFGLPPADTARLVLTCARIDRQKNQLFLLELLPDLLAIEPRTHLVFLGPVTNADYAQKLRETAQATGHAHRVHLLGGMAPDDPSLVDAYHAADLFWLPSLHEPFGIAILEAWAASKPVIAARVGGIPSFVEDGHDALLTPPTDRVAGSQAFARLMNSTSGPRLAAQLAGNGHQKACSQFDWDIISNRLLQLYHEILRQKR